MAASYAVLAWSCERVATGVRAKMEGSNAVGLVKQFLTPGELALSEKYLGELKAEEGEMDGMDELKEINQIDAARGQLVEQRPEVKDVMVGVEDALKKGILIGLAKMLREMGYEKWPSDPEGRADMKNVISAVSRELTQLGRRFSGLLRKELNVLKRLGPKRYTQVMARWTRGQPSEPTEEPEEARGYDEDGVETGQEPEKAPEKAPEQDPKGTDEGHETHVPGHMPGGELPGGPSGGPEAGKPKEIVPPEKKKDEPSEDEEMEEAIDRVLIGIDEGNADPRDVCLALGLTPGTPKHAQYLAAVKNRLVAS